jgi:hypothetical protein
MIHSPPSLSGGDRVCAAIRVQPFELYDFSSDLTVDNAKTTIRVLQVESDRFRKPK